MDNGDFTAPKHAENSFQKLHVTPEMVQIGGCRQSCEILCLISKGSIDVFFWLTKCSPTNITNFSFLPYYMSHAEIQFLKMCSMC